MAVYLRRVFEEMGLRGRLAGGGRRPAPTWVARLPGSGNGKSLMFNGHMDTSNTGREPFLTGIGYKPRAVLKDGMVFGLGIYN
jgi:acetylornithine deacetylase/succinyl-diaminopimelate desuccinylase-like protein